MLLHHLHLTVAATKMNVFYMGVDNPVSISVPGIAEANLRPSISVGTLTRDATGKKLDCKSAARAENCYFC